MAESQFLINHCGMTPLSLTMSKHEGDGFSIVKAVVKRFRSKIFIFCPLLHFLSFA